MLNRLSVLQDPSFAGGVTPTQEPRRATVVVADAQPLFREALAGALAPRPALVSPTLLLAMFGSVVIAVKAMVLNLLSLSATFGALVWGFQEGHLAGALGVAGAGGGEPVLPLLI